MVRTYSNHVKRANACHIGVVSLQNKSENPIPDDIVAEIVSHLPVKSLLRFRCVSKLWKSIITYTMESLKKSLNTYIVFSCPDLHLCSLYSLYYEHNVVISYQDLPVAGSVSQLVGSCDGLICIAVIKEDLILWNPSTKEYNNLPKIPTYDDISLPFAYYFCFGKYDGDYKIVCFCKCYQHCDDMVIIFSMRTSQWKRIVDCRPLMSLSQVSKSKLVNGKINWVNENYLDWEIGYIDVVKEEYGIVSKPTNASPRYDTIGLGVSEECLYVYCNYKLSGDVWSLNADQSWTKLVTIEHNGSIEGCLKEFHVHKKNGEIMFMWSNKNVIFNITDNSFRYPKFSWLYYHITEASKYVPSSISPFKINDNGQ